MRHVFCTNSPTPHACLDGRTAVRRLRSAQMTRTPLSNHLSSNRGGLSSGWLYMCRTNGEQMQRPSPKAFGSVRLACKGTHAPVFDMRARGVRSLGRAFQCCWQVNSSSVELLLTNEDCPIACSRPGPSVLCMRRSACKGEFKIRLTRMNEPTAWGLPSWHIARATCQRMKEGKPDRCYVRRMSQCHCCPREPLFGKEFLIALS